MISEDGDEEEEECDMENGHDAYDGEDAEMAEH